jgi:hypothetical protein
MFAFGKRPAIDRANDSSADYKHVHRVNRSHIQFFFETADRIAGSPNATHCAISASTQMYQHKGKSKSVSRDTPIRRNGTYQRNGTSRKRVWRQYSA